MAAAGGGGDRTPELKRHYRLEDLQGFLAARGNPNSRDPDSPGYSLLGAACRDAFSEKIGALLRAGANPNVPGLLQPPWTQVTPLQLLLEARNPRIEDIRALLTAGADANGGSRIQHIMELGGNTIPLERSKVKLPLFQAIENKSVEQVQALLRAGADANSPHRADSAYFGNPLEFCIYHGTPRILELLQEAGANWEGARPTLGIRPQFETPLDAAVDAMGWALMRIPELREMLAEPVENADENDEEEIQERLQLRQRREKELRDLLAQKRELKGIIEVLEGYPKFQFAKNILNRGNRNNNTRRAQHEVANIENVRHHLAQFVARKPGSGGSRRRLRRARKRATRRALRLRNRW